MVSGVAMWRKLFFLFLIVWAGCVLIVMQTTHILTLIDDPAQTAGPAYGMFLLAAASAGFWSAWVPAVAMVIFARSRHGRVGPALWVVFGYWAMLGIAAIILERRLLVDTPFFELQFRQLIMLPFTPVGIIDALSRPSYIRDAGLMLLPPLALMTALSVFSSVFKGNAFGKVKNLR